MPLAIQTKNLSHRFTNGNLAVDSIELEVPLGSIYCFLGPNGAGKTTTLRLLLGLIRNSESNIHILGMDLRKSRLAVLRQVGAFIEVPSLYGHLNAYENLEIYRRLYGCDKNRLDQVLTLVDLLKVAKKKTNGYSLGMKQRLALAMTLLHEPQLIILDEPTNGLDPQGIAEIRQTIQELNRTLGITFLISSHLLSEVEKLATHVGIIHHGKMRFQGSLDALYAQTIHKAHVLIRTNNDSEAISYIDVALQAKLSDEGIHLPHIDPNTIAKINRHLVERQIDVYSIRTEQNNLESHFLQILASK
jgi:lantibiotic transport system ATP-binding protein